MTTTSSRTIQWIAIILIITVIAGGIYHYFNVRGATINKSQSTLTNGLVAWWTFDGADTVWTSSSAGTTLDKSGQNNTGTLTSMTLAATPTTGKIGQALSFNGSSRYVDIAGLTANTLFQDTTFSVSAWIKTSATSGVVISKGATSGGSFSGWLVRIQASGVLEALTKAGASNAVVLDSVGTVNDNAWHFVTAVFTTDTVTLGNNNTIIYIDGVLNSGSISRALTPIFSSATVQIGRRPDGTYFNGKIDDVRIYNRALSAAEVGDLYRMGTATVNASTNALNTNGLIGQWSFDGKQTVWTSPTAATTLDTSGSGNTGTLSNMTLATAPVAGKIGQALYFDGGDTSGITLTGVTTGTSYSIVAWMKPTSAMLRTLATIVAADNFALGIYLYQPTGDAINIFASSGDFDLTRVSAQAIPLNKWTHVVVLVNNGNVSFYINGVLDANTYTGQPAFTGANVANRIGFDSNGFVFKGALDDVRIYNRVLTSNEVADLYQTGTATVNASTNALNTNGLIGQWSFDGKQTVWTSPTAATTLDTSGNNNTGTLTNMTRAASPTPGKIGQALLFNGSTSGITLTGVTTTTTYSIAAWMKPTGAPPGLLGSIVSADNVQVGIYLLQPTGDETILNILAWNGSDIDRTSAQLIPLNRWTHVVVLVNSGNVSFYINGVLDANTYPSQPAFTGANVANRIGFDSSSLDFKGALDDVRIYNRVLSTSEIAALYNQGR